MAISKFNVEVNNIQALDDNPNTSGMSSSELKATFDKAGADIKTYINNTLTDEIDTTISSSVSQINTRIDGLFNLIYPVGAIYMSVNATNPGTLFGGTWQRIENRFLISAGSSYAAGSTGGSATRTLAIGNMPAHNHGNPTTNLVGQAWNMVGQDSNGPGTSNSGIITGAGDAKHAYPSSTKFTTGRDGIQINANHQHATQGSGQAFSIMPPYLAVYVWKRTG